MPVSEARTFARPRDQVVVEPNQSDDDRAALVGMALECEQFSPCVGLEETEQPECLMLDITGVAPLFGGEEGLAQRIDREFTTQRYEVRVAIADTLGAAWAAAHYLTQAKRTAIVPAGQFDDLVQLPVGGLRLGEVEHKKLHRLGIRTIQQLLKLDRSLLPSRFGNGLTLRLAQFLGERQELITPCRPQPKFETERILEEGSTHPESIEQLCLMLLKELLNQLVDRHLETRHLVCRFLMEDRTVRELSLRLCEATADVSHITQLFRFQLEQLRLNSSVIGVRWEATDNSPLQTSQAEFFADRPRDEQRQFHALLDRLSSRLGSSAVVRPRLLPNPIPERAVEFVPVAEESDTPVANSPQFFLPGDRPTSLLAQPIPIEVIDNLSKRTLVWKNSRFDIDRQRGPERIESGWWHGTIIRRDYFWIETTEGNHFWIFQRLSDQQWFLHGEMV